ncbi:Type II secretion system F domain protein [Methanolacinia petrolearia DSM 11571]|uniref:Type II secretion system F domain protein n=1 Tax=Methanolacinia petrolearia (strain DSM 11571 / OCM 486 / SEBR 4847) TaxID=679926 RepID=E1RFS8_METP4|nr:type II secretion system F family protein [Methanolacinia petrolearia]ADN37382.1 Type II secretion system F domain protein [Methanolacinia petrolearia DSM 11571]
MPDSNNNTKKSRSISLKKRIQDLKNRLNLKYNIKREYFTLILPIILAVILLIAGLIINIPYIMGNGADDENPANEKQKAYEELLKQMEEGESGGEESANVEGIVIEETIVAEDESAKPQGMDQFLIFAILIAITPYGIDITLQKMAKKRKEELFTEFLFKLSEMMRGGLDPIKSVNELAKAEIGVLTPHIRIAANRMAYGDSFERAMKAMARSTGSELIARYTELVIEASYSGGGVSDLILKCSDDMRSILSIERQKEGDLKQFVLIFYFAQIIIIFICYTLTNDLLPYFTDLGSTSFLGDNEIANMDFSTGFFHLILINSFFGGLIIGKISEGDVRYGLKHVTILMIVSYVSCMILLFGGTGASVQDVEIEIVSGAGQEGYVGLPLKENLVIGVTDPDGNPVEDATVVLSISPGGKVTESLITDNEGICETDVVLGDTPGVYTIEITSGRMTKKITVLAISG